MCALLGATAAPAGAVSASSQQRQTQINNQISSLKSQIQEVSAAEAGLLKQYNQIQAQRQALDAKVGALDVQVAAAQGQLDSANANLTGLDVQVAAAQAQFDQAESELSHARHSLTERAVSAYADQPEAHLIDVLLRARTFRELAAAKGYLEILVQDETDNVDAVRVARSYADAARTVLKDKQSQAQAARDVVASQVATIVAARQAQDALRQQAAAQEAKRSILVAAARAQKALFTREIVALQAESNSITALLRGVQKGQKLTVSGHGILAVPIPGAPITSPFGMRFDPILQTYSMHTGVDFGAPMGTPIHAAADGVVVWAGARGGYGNCTIIDHGNSLATLYAHQSVIGVVVGQHVTRNQVIGKVGSTGMSTGPHLHFEVRVNGVPVDPLQYL